MEVEKLPRSAAVAEFRACIDGIEGVELVLGNANSTDACAFTQVVLRIDEAKLGRSKTEFKDALYARGVPVWHANFELINSLSLFSGSAWEEWLPRAEFERTRANYAAAFPVATKMMQSAGLGLGKMNFLSGPNLKHLKKQIETLARRSK